MFWDTVTLKQVPSQSLTQNSHASHNLKLNKVPYMPYESSRIWKIPTSISNDYQGIIFIESKFKLTVIFGNWVPVSDLDWECRYEGIYIYNNLNDENKWYRKYNYLKIVKYLRNEYQMSVYQVSTFGCSI